MTDPLPNADSGRAISGNFELTCALSTARQFRVTGYLFTDDTVEDILKRVAVAQDVCDLQGIRMDIVAKEAQISQHAVAMESAQEHVASLLDLQKKGKTLTGAQKVQVNNLDAQLAAGKAAIDSLRAAVKAGRQRLNGSAPA